MKRVTPQRIGIYAGTFDPVHTGHIAFALQAIETAKLDQLYFLPERRPRHKKQVEHFGHRVAMLERAVRPHPKFEVLELPDICFDIKRTLPRLQRQFRGSDLVFLFGSDSIIHLAGWQHAKQLLKNSELVVGLRWQDARASLERVIADWPVAPQAVHILNSYAPDVSSGLIREALRQRRTTDGLLSSVERYSDQNWLYVSLA